MRKVNKIYLSFILLLFLLSILIMSMFIMAKFNTRTYSNEQDSIYVVKIKDDKKLSRNDLSSLSISEKDKVIYLMNNYFNDVFNIHSDNYCGDVNKKEALVIDGAYEYIRVMDYNNYKDIEKYLSDIVSVSYIDKNLKNSFTQNNDKLYCRASYSESLNYINNSFELVEVLKDKNKITILGNYDAVNVENKKENYRVYATLTTNNNNYVVNTYEEY